MLHRTTQAFRFTAHRRMLNSYGRAMGWVLCLGVTDTIYDLMATQTEIVFQPFIFTRRYQSKTKSFHSYLINVPKIYGISFL